MTSVDFGIDTRHIKLPLITQQESHTTSCNRNFRCLKQGIKNRNSVLKRVGKSVLFVLNRVRVRGAWPHLPTQGYNEYPPGFFSLHLKSTPLYLTCQKQSKTQEEIPKRPTKSEFRQAIETLTLQFVCCRGSQDPGANKPVYVRLTLPFMIHKSTRKKTKTAEHSKIFQCICCFVRHNIISVP